MQSRKAGKAKRKSDLPTIKEFIFPAKKEANWQMSSIDSQFYYNHM